MKKRYTHELGDDIGYPFYEAYHNSNPVRAGGDEGDGGGGHPIFRIRGKRQLSRASKEGERLTDCIFECERVERDSGGWWKREVADGNPAPSFIGVTCVATGGARAGMLVHPLS